MRFDFSEDRRLMEASGSGAPSVPTAKASDVTGGLTGAAAAKDPQTALETQRRQEFNMQKAQSAIEKALNLTPEAAQRLLNNILDVAKEAQSNNQRAAKEQWDAVLKSLQSSMDANAGVSRSIEQTKAGFSGMCTVIAEVCTSFGWTKAADSLKDLAKRLEPKAVLPDTKILEARDPSQANGRDFTQQVLTDLTGDSALAKSIARDAIGQTSDAAGKASRELDDVPTTQSGKAGESFMSVARYNKMVDRARVMGAIGFAEAMQMTRGVDADGDGKVSKAEVQAKASKDLAQKAGVGSFAYAPNPNGPVGGV